MRMLLGYKMMNVVLDDVLILEMERALYERSIINEAVLSYRRGCFSFRRSYI